MIVEVYNYDCNYDHKVTLVTLIYMSEEHNVSSYYYIQSDHRQVGQTDSNFTVSPPNFANSSDFEVATVQIPYTFYPFNTFMNTLSFQVNGGGTVTATLTPGYYDVGSLPTALVAAMNAVSGGPTYTITISPITAQMTITQNAGTFIILPSPMNPLIGFSTSASTASSNIHVSPNIINLGGTAYLDIYSTELTKHSSRFYDSSQSGSNRFLRVPISDYAFGSTIIYKPLFRHYNMKPESANNIDIQLKDMYGNYISLNGRNFYIKLKFHTDKPHRNTIRAGNHNDYFANNNVNKLDNKGRDSAQSLANKL